MSHNEVNPHQLQRGAIACPLTDEALCEWLSAERGIDEYRRVVRENESAVVISKFEPGFSQELFATVDILPELFDEDAIAAAYEALADAYQRHGEAPLRTAVWREASEAALDRGCRERGIADQRRMYVLPGIESVQAVMDSILWSAPTVADRGYRPNAGELQAYRDFEGGEGERTLFTRYYGDMDGRRVENHCPGAPFGRRLVAQAWNICTGRVRG
ncbi:MAG TPA: hypothetical protein VH951_08620 [Dehalococcoidia bacterium]